MKTDGEMESWENIILQWINCLYDSSNSIKTVEELQDGKIYYNLIDRIIPWSNNKKSNKNQRDIVLQFLKDEYPNFPFKNENSAISKFCFATLMLSRLSLEPIFHKMYTNLDVDIQIKIKSILETVYSLDKSITEGDLYNIFSLSSKKDLKLLGTKPKFILDESIETPVPIDDTTQLEQTKQIKQLKVIETMEYENSDLVADVVTQDRHTKDLQNKLQEDLSELKIVKIDADSDKFNSNFTESKDKKDIESLCRKEDSLEKYVYKLQNDNYQLQDQKKALATKVKQLYKEKCEELKEKNENMKKAIELIILTKSQERQIKDLQSKLQETLYAKDKNAIETAYLSKLKGLEESVMKLETKNYQLEQEKQSLVIDELKLYKEKHYILKEKNENQKKAFEAVKLIKSQERQIKDLQNKLIDSEKSQTKLKSKNYQLYKEKCVLIDELKVYKEKQGILKETNEKEKNEKEKNEREKNVKKKKAKHGKALETAHFSQLERLEKSAMILKIKNDQLEQGKDALIDEKIGQQ